VLEIGCGQGREAIRLQRNVLRVDALDHSPVAINTANQRVALNGAAINFRQHDVTERLPYEPHVFDGIFSHLSLHYFDDRTTHRIFDDLARVLKPRGILYFTVRSVRDPLFGQGTRVAENIFCRNGHVRHFFTTEYATKILSSWDVKVADHYDTFDRTINPGNFIRVLAYAP
jgi:SAM-dependent methyltransferase